MLNLTYQNEHVAQPTCCIFELKILQIFDNLVEPKSSLNVIAYKNYLKSAREESERNILPARFSRSHLEFLGLMWLSHHQEYLRLDSE